MSPAFLYRVETAPRATETALNDWELASRLSFFLWSSIPDEELRRAAAAGELSDPTKLAAQVRRMTADAKARRIATEFFGQWLGFYHFDQYRGVDTGRFPDFTDDVKTSMHEEAIATFEYIVRAGTAGEGDPARRLRVPEPDAREVLRHRREAGAWRQVRARGRRGRVRPRRRPAARVGPDDDVGAAQDESCEARRLDSAAHPLDPDASAAPPTPARCRPTTRASRGRRCASAWRSTSATRGARRATCASIRWAFRSKASMPWAARARRMPTASRSTSPASSGTRRRSSARAGS